MIYDCFPFYNEFEILRIRLRELSDVVDRFILVEGSTTHTGHPKPYYFQEAKAQFREYGDRIVGKTIELPTAGREPWFNWGREIVQRGAINSALKELGAKDDDLILSSDVDEIPRPEAVKLCREKQWICALQEKTYHYNLHCVLDTPTVDPKAALYGLVRQMGVADLRYYHQAHPVYVIEKAGWHLSFMGGTDRIIEKMKAYAHYDVREPKMEAFVSRQNVEASVQGRKSLFQREDIHYSWTDDLADLPKDILERRDYFIKNGWMGGGR